MSEHALEQAFVKWVRSVGGEAVKGPAYQYKGIPDRIAILPNGGTVYVEFKASILCDLEPLQKYWRQLLLKSDYNRYFVVDNKEALEYTIGRCKELIEQGKTYNKEFKNKSLYKSFERNDFSYNDKFFIASPCVFTNKNSGNPITVYYNTLSKGSLVYLDNNDTVCIIKDILTVEGNLHYTFELYYQYCDQTGATPIKFIS